VNIERKLNQTATVWQNPVSDGWGSFTYDAPREVLARWDDTAVLFRDRATGSEVVSQSVVHVKTEEGIKEGDMIAYGDQTAFTNPYEIQAWVIKNVQNIPNLRATQSITRLLT